MLQSLPAFSDLSAGLAPMNSCPDPRLSAPQPREISTCRLFTVRGAYDFAMVR
jgi:hypothetical protein